MIAHSLTKLSLAGCQAQARARKSRERNAGEIWRRDTTQDLSPPLFVPTRLPTHLALRRAAAITLRCVCLPVPAPVC